MKSRNLVILGLSTAAASALAVAALSLPRLFSKPAPAQPREIVTTHQPGGEVGEVPSPRFPEWAADLLQGSDPGWLEINAKLSAMTDGERNLWRGWLPEAFEKTAPADPRFGRIVMIAGLLRVIDESIVVRIIALCDAEDALISQKAKIALSLVQPYKSEGLLSSLLTSADPAVRAEACQAAVLLGEAWAEKALIWALEDENAGVCRAAMEAMAQYSCSLPEAEASILKHARGSDSVLRVPALRLIAAWKIENGYQLLHETASRGDRESRLATVTSLSKNPDPRTRETLVILMEDRDDAIRAAAEKAVARMDGAEGPEDEARK